MSFKYQDGWIGLRIGTQSAKFYLGREKAYRRFKFHVTRMLCWTHVRLWRISLIFDRTPTEEELEKAASEMSRDPLLTSL